MKVRIEVWCTGDEHNHFFKKTSKKRASIDTNSGKGKLFTIILSSSGLSHLQA